MIGSKFDLTINLDNLKSKSGALHVLVCPKPNGRRQFTFETIVQLYEKNVNIMFQRISKIDTLVIFCSVSKTTKIKMRMIIKSSSGT